MIKSLLLLLISVSSFAQIQVKGRRAVMSAPIAVAYNPDLYELIGQSNADGQANNSGIPTGLTGVLADCKIYTPFTNAFVDVHAGVNNQTAGGGNAHGIELRLLKSLQASTSRTQYLAKYAIPGTQLGQTGGNDWAHNSTGEYYANSNINTAAAMALLDNKPPRAIIWDQGEGDAYSTFAAAYYTNLVNFIAAKRAVYGYSVPFIIVSLSNNQTFLDPTGLALVKAAQLSVSQDIDNCYLIPTEDIAFGDGLHFQEPGTDSIAQRVIRVLNNLPSSGSASYALTSSASTSAGIFTPTGALVKTLWAGEQKAPGSYSLPFWDGKNNDGSLVADGAYNFRLTSNDIASQWGIIGNTSDSLTGETVNHSMDVITSMVFAGNYCYYSVAYNEGNESHFKFNINTPNQKIRYLKGQGQPTSFEATDGVRVYHAGVGFEYAPDDADYSETIAKQFVFATNVSDDTEYTFSSGVTKPANGNIFFGRTYNSAIDVTTSTIFSGDPTNPNIPECSIGGMAVQQAGNYLFVSYYDVNEIHVLNKTTGALVQTIATFTAPKYLTIDKNNDNAIWIISNTTTVSKHTINSNGTLTAATLTLSGLVKPLSTACKSGTIAVQDGGTKQQVRFFSNTTGTEGTPLGQLGGYATSSTVANDKFFFANTKEFFRGDRNNFIAFGLDGSLWVGDRGNYRVQHFNSSNVYLGNIMNIGYFYMAQALKSDPTKVFANYLQFSVDYSNLSWTFTNNWAYGISPELDDQSERLRNVYTGSNGRMYALAKHRYMVSSTEYHRYQFVELMSGGNLRFTGVEPSFTGDQFDVFYTVNSDNTILRLTSVTPGEATQWISYPITYDGANNPVIGTGSTLASLSSISTNDPIVRSGFTSDQITENGTIVSYDPEKISDVSEGVTRGAGYHLAGIKSNATNWQFKASPSTTLGPVSGTGNNRSYPFQYEGQFPKNGDYDIANGVNYAGSYMQASDKFIVCGYHGENWKNNQVDKLNFFYQDGTFLYQAGTTGVDAREYGEAPPNFAGNTLTGSFRKLNDSTYIVVGNDEGQHGAVRIQKLTGMNTVAQQTISITKTGTPISPALNYTDLMTGVPVSAPFDDVGRWTRTPFADINGTGGEFLSIKTTNQTYKPDESDINVYHVPPNGINKTVTLSCNLGDINLSQWAIKGQFTFRGIVDRAVDSSRGYLEILDAADKVIFRLGAVQYDAQTDYRLIMNNTIAGQGGIIDFLQKIRYLEDITITVNSSGVALKYGTFTASAPILDPTANWQSPKTLRVYMNSSTGVGHTMDVSNLKFYPAINITP